MFNLNINKVKMSGLFLILMAFFATGHADDVQDSIKEAVEYYENGEYKDAVESLNYASQLIQQMKAKELESFLPKPLSGWSAQEASSQAAGASMFGGGIAVERKYSKGSSSTTIEIITDSPMIQGMMMMFSNPMFATSDGGKLERIGREKAIVKFNPSNKQGEITIIVANQFLVLIKGRETSKEDLKAYAKAIDYKKLKSF